MSRIAVVGTGYVGLVTGACLADFGNTVRCIDVDAAKIARLSAGEIPFYEPGLEELVARTAQSGRLLFQTDLAEAARWAEVIFITVGTPPQADGSADLSAVFAVGDVIARSVTGLQGGRPEDDGAGGHRAPAAGRDAQARRAPGHHRRGVEPRVPARGLGDRDLHAARPRGRRRRDGEGREAHARALRAALPARDADQVTNLETAELIKYASNAFLATKISFINEMANLCEAVGADVQTVARAMGQDRRIGSKFLHAGPGYGGSCFPKDTLALAAFARERGAPFRLVEAVVDVNERQKARMVEKVAAAVGSPRGKRIAILGLTFKPNTDDIREAPALDIARGLLRRGAKLSAYDPVGMDHVRRLPLGKRITFAADAYEAVDGADCAVLVTEWNELRTLDLKKLVRRMRRPAPVRPAQRVRRRRGRRRGHEVRRRGPGRPAGEEARPQEEPMIQDVVVKPLKVIADERGYLMEMLRCDDPVLPVVRPGLLLGGLPGRGQGLALPQDAVGPLRHRHGHDEGRALRHARGLADEGRGQRVLHGREEPDPGAHSAGRGARHEGHRSRGRRCSSTRRSHPYHYAEPDEFRVHPHDNDIPYDWSRKDG